MSSRPSGTVTFLFTDIQGSTKLWQSQPEAMKHSHARHNEILRSAIESSEGYVFEIVGDAFCAAFHSADHAVQAAVSAQLDLQSEDWGEAVIRVRMGIHTGKAELRDNGLYSGYTTLSRVQRLMSAAHGGQGILSSTTGALARDNLPPGVALRDLGEHRLKDVLHPEHIFQVVAPGLPADFPALRTLDSFPNNLPLQLTSFVGREEEVAAIHGYLSDPGRRLVTLIGPPGIGKTRLALESAAACLTDFSDGAFFVGLASIEDADLVPAAIMQTLGFVQTGRQTAVEQLMDGIADKSLLLVLDNLEQITAGAAALVSALLGACPRLKVLATSREALHVPGEWLFPVPALPLPDASRMELEQARGLPALMLFAERARAVRPDFAIQAGNVEAVAGICERMDGLPLGIELVAARIRLMPPQALLKRLGDELTLPLDEVRGVPGRQRTLEAAIRWSYNLLNEQEQQFFADLSVFSGGFTLEAAEAICAAPGSQVMGLVASLLDKSLLRQGPETAGEPRFDMLVTIRLFAGQRLGETGSEEAVRDRHLAYFLELAARVDEHIHGPDQIEWMGLVAEDYDNFRAALELCFSRKNTEAGLRLLGLLDWAWWLQGRERELLAWSARLRELTDVADHPALYARLLNAQGRMRWLAGEMEKSQTALEEARLLWLGLGVEGEVGLAEANAQLGLLLNSSGGDPKTVQSVFEQSYELSSKHGDKWGTAFAVFLLGFFFSEHGDRDRGRSLLEQSLEMFRQLGDPWGAGRVSQRLGELFLWMGDFERARIYLSEHLRIDESLHFRQGTAIALLDMGELYRHQGQDDQAQEFYEKALALCREYGLKADWGNVSWFRALIALRQGDFPLARQHLDDYVDIAGKIAGIIAACDYLTGMAAVAAGAGQPERAARLNGAALTLLETTSYRIPPFDQAQMDRHIDLARRQLGEERFQALEAEGRGMTLEQALAFARETRV